MGIRSGIMIIEDWHRHEMIPLNCHTVHAYCFSDTGGNSCTLSPRVDVYTKSAIKMHSRVRIRLTSTESRAFTGFHWTFSEHDDYCVFLQCLQ